MSLIPRPLKSGSGTLQADGEFVTDYRQRLALEEYERAEKKRLELADQRSTLNAPEARIRAWEKVHHLRLPSDPKHPVLDVIAVATQLTLDDVLEEQRARMARKAVTAA
ncbi:MAG: hypothetical protein WDO56_11040 [Gammaproteobacteria bacterium]